MAFKRLAKEAKALRQSPPTGLELRASEDNPFEWKGVLYGQEGTPYVGGMFQFQITIPERYPFQPPEVRFTTPVYHPNITSQGEVCVDILKEMWAPSYTLEKVMMSIKTLMWNPNPYEPVAAAPAEECIKNRPLYDRKAREWTIKYAMKKVEDEGESTADFFYTWSTPAPTAPKSWLSFLPGFS